MRTALGHKRLSPPSLESVDEPDPVPPQVEAPPREITARAVLMGCALGAVLAAANVYTGLKTSFIDGGSITAALLGFAFFATFQRRGRTPYSALENNITQTTAASAAIMGFVVGVSGPIPALSLMGREYPIWSMAVWGIALGAVSVVLAASLRRKLIQVEKLPFPTGAATAEVIETIYAARQSALRRARLLLVAAVSTMLFTWFRDGRPSVIPQVTLFGATIAGVSTAALSLGISWSPLMISTGAIMGMRNSASMLLGSAVSWLVLAPWLVSSGIVPAATFGACVSWLVWPGLGLLVAGSFVPLILDWRGIVRSFRDLPSLLRQRGGGAALSNGDGDGDGARPAAEGIRHGKLILVGGVGVMVWVGWATFDLSPLITLLALAVSATLASVAARATGETDVAPTGQMGLLTQLIFAGHGPTVPLLTGSVSAGQASQTAQTLWALKAGDRLKASARAQIWAQLLGVVLGGLVVAPAYVVIAKSYGIGTEAMPAPAALSWKATAEAVRGGLGAMPKYGPLAGGIGLALGVLLTLASRTRMKKLVPSPAAMGVAVLTPMALACAAFLGGLAVYTVRRVRPQSSETSIMTVAAGCIAGESVMGVIVAILIAAGWL